MEIVISHYAEEEVEKLRYFLQKEYPEAHVAYCIEELDVPKIIGGGS